MPLAVLVVSVVLGLGTGATAVVVGTRGDEPTTPTPAAGVESEAVRLLRAWDARRARAYASGDPAALASLYVAGSRTGRADVRVLRGYLARDLTVTGMRTQVLGAEVVRRTSHRLTVEVTDVLVGAVARSGDRRWALPHDRPSMRRVELVLVAGEWRVGEAYAVD
jgi:hypothetical protein